MAVLGLPGFRVVATDEVDGELEVTVATTAQRAWCGSCGVRAHSQGRLGDVRARRGRLRPVRAAAVGQTTLALSRAGLPRHHLDGDE